MHHRNGRHPTISIKSRPLLRRRESTERCRAEARPITPEGNHQYTRLATTVRRNGQWIITGFWPGDSTTRRAGRQAGRSDHNAVRHWDVSSVRPAFRYEITKIAPRALFPRSFACRGTLSRRTSGAVTESHCNGNAGLSIAGNSAPRETKRFSFSPFSLLPLPFSLIRGRNTRFYPSISRSCGWSYYGMYYLRQL